MQSSYFTYLIFAILLLGLPSAKGQEPPTPQFPTFEVLKLPNHSTAQQKQSQDKTIQIIKRNQEEELKRQEAQAQLLFLDSENKTKTDTEKKQIEKRNIIYEQTAQELQKMIEGVQNQDITKAIVLIENNYYQQKDFETNFNKKLSDIIELLQKFAKEKELDWANYEARQQVLLFFFMNPLVFKDGTAYKDPQYNHEAPFGLKDLTNTFVSKILNANLGQCYSLPLLYQVLAEKINVK